MRFYFIFLFFIILSCKENITNPDTESEIPIAEIYCFYPMDDKYHESTDKVELENWVDGKNQTVLIGEPQFNLFEREGGGPNGAEWNASAALCLVIRGSQDYQISLNGEVYEEEPVRFGDFDWLVVKRTDWENRLRKMEREDRDFMFPEGIPLEETFPIVPIKEMDFGEVIRFELTTADTTVIEYFHVAFGE